MSTFSITPKLSAERDWWAKRLLEAERKAYLAGEADGFLAGYNHGTRVIQAEWPAIARPLTGPTLAELELLRWGPGGREQFGARRPSDRFPAAP